MGVLKVWDAGLGQWVEVAGGVSDHGALTGLTDDDHSSYPVMVNQTATPSNPVADRPTLWYDTDDVPAVYEPTAPVRRVYTAGATWTKPAGLRYIEVEVQGAGGGSGGVIAGSPNGANSGGGGGGGYAKKLLSAAALASLTTATVVVGAGGTAGATTPTAGGTGGVSSFAGTGITTVQGNGGVGSAGVNNVSWNQGIGGVGGTATGGDYNIQGGYGGSAWTLPHAVASPSGSGFGGTSQLGGGTYPSSNAAGNVGRAYGGGAGGAQLWSPSGTVSFVGGVGGAGIVIVTEYYA